MVLTKVLFVDHGLAAWLGFFAACRTAPTSHRAIFAKFRMVLKASFQISRSQQGVRYNFRCGGDRTWRGLKVSSVLHYFGAPVDEWDHFCFLARFCSAVTGVTYQNDEAAMRVIERRMPLNFGIFRRGARSK